MFNGLTTQEAKERLKEFGYNELPAAQPKNIWRIALEVVKEPMFLLLLGCGGLYLTLGDYKEGIILLSTIFIIIGITFYQYQKTERALEALRNLSSPRALVIRDGREMRIAGREVVPGDLVVLNEGDRIAADATLVKSLNLTVDESLLTGESLPVMKTIDGTQSSLFGGTLIVQGSGLARVTAIGVQSQFGKIGMSLQRIESDETRLQTEMKRLIKNLFIIGTILSIGVVLAFYFSRGNFIQSLLNGLAASMAILPEEFPVVLTIFMALGAWRLSQKNVLTRRPSAIETLGSATVLCSDKTGTITQNKMEVAVLYDGHQVISREHFGQSSETFTLLLRAGYRASQQNSVDPMEQAIQKSHEQRSTIEAGHEIVREYPVTRQLLAMTRVLQHKESTATSISAKGAPESIFDLCKLDKDETEKHMRVVHEMAALGCRVIGVAEAVHSATLPDHQSGFNFSFTGLIGLEDPIRPEVPQAIKECREAGIKVIMITGDFPATAQSIAKQIGLSGEGQIIAGSDLAAMSDEELKKKIKQTSIFARIVPEQKLRIVQALKANGEIVAMTGDGVNDAPALRAADIGVAMGNKGTDVAREASSLVLLDDNFASIVSAIHSGRRIFDNLQKAMSYIIAIHIPIIGLTLLPALIPSLPLLLLPLHIVFMELIIDPVCTVAFEAEQDEKGIMQRKPRDPNDSFFGPKRIVFSILAGILIFSMVVAIYFLSLNEGHTEGEVRAIAFSTLIIGNIFLVLTDLSKTRSFISVFKEKNFAAIGILLGALILLLLVISVPGLQVIFSFEFPGYQHFVPALIASGIILFIFESLKYFRNKKIS